MSEFTNLTRQSQMGLMLDGRLQRNRYVVQEAVIIIMVIQKGKKSFPLNQQLCIVQAGTVLLKLPSFSGEVEQWLPVILKNSTALFFENRDVSLHVLVNFLLKFSLHLKSDTTFLPFSPELLCSFSMHSLKSATFYPKNVHG